MNINKLKPYIYVGKAPKGLEVTIEGGGEHKEDLENKEDSQKCFQFGFIENENTLKIRINQNNLVTSIRKPKYKTT